MIWKAFHRCRGAALGCMTALMVVGALAPVRAADFDMRAVAGPDTGVDCQGPDAARFSSVWLGHFSGGLSHYAGPGGPVLLDWRDETLCFPSRRSCGRWVSGLRGGFHRPEGYFTCLTIR